MAEHYGELERDASALRWWTLWTRLASRFAADTHCMGHVFERLTRELDGEEFDEALHAMTVIYDAVCPQKRDG